MLRPMWKLLQQHGTLLRENLVICGVDERRVGMEHHSLQKADSQEEVGTERIQAFSDGVFAVAITLLILDIHVPTLEQTRGDALALLTAMRHLWPYYLSFFLSFLFVGTIWSNHHTMFSYIKRSNQVLILLNLLLLLCVVVVAFTADLLGLYITQPAQWVAVLIYNGVLVICCVCYHALWW